MAVPVGTGNGAMVTTAITGRTDAMGNVTQRQLDSHAGARMDAAVTYFAGVTEPNPKYILLATDGLPNCTGTTNNQNRRHAGRDHGRGERRGTAGIPTFVVGISAPAGAANDAMNMMATAGGLARTGADPLYYPVTSAAELVAAVNALVTIAASCVFPVPPPPTNDGTTNRSNIIVKGDGTRNPDGQVAHQRLGLHRRGDDVDDALRSRVRGGHGRHDPDGQHHFNCVVP